MFEFNYVPSFIGKLKDLIFLKVINVDETIRFNKALDQAFELRTEEKFGSKEGIHNKFKFESLHDPHMNTSGLLDIPREYVKKL